LCMYVYLKCEADLFSSANQDVDISHFFEQFKPAKCNCLYMYVYLKCEAASIS